MTTPPSHRLRFPRLMLALLAAAALALSACSGSSPDTSVGDTAEPASQSAGDDGARPDDSDPGGDDGDAGTATNGVPDWYVCNDDTFFASSIPVSVVGANTPEDEELGGILAVETFTFGVDGDNSQCEIFYGSDADAQRQGNLSAMGLVGAPASVSRLFDNFVSAPAEPQTIGSVDALVASKSFGVAIYFEVDGAGVILTVDSFLDEHDENEAGVIGLQLAELVVAAAS